MALADVELFPDLRTNRLGVGKAQCRNSTVLVMKGQLSFRKRFTMLGLVKHLYLKTDI